MSLVLGTLFLYPLIAAIFFWPPVTADNAAEIWRAVSWPAWGISLAIAGGLVPLRRGKVDFPAVLALLLLVATYDLRVYAIPLGRSALGAIRALLLLGAVAGYFRYRQGRPAVART